MKSTYGVEALVLLLLVSLLSYVHRSLFLAGAWALLGAGLGVSASERRFYPARLFVPIGAVLGPLALVLYLAPRFLRCPSCRQLLPSRTLRCEACGWERYAVAENPLPRRSPAPVLPFRPRVTLWRTP